MEKNDVNLVKSFLKKASDIEIALYRCNKTIDYLENKMQWFGQEFSKVEQYKYGDHLKERHELPGGRGKFFGAAQPARKLSGVMDIVLSAMITALLPAVIIAFIYGVVLAESTSDLEYIVTKMIICGVVIFALITCFISVTGIKKQEEKYNSSKSNYEEQLEKRNELLRKEKRSFEICQMNVNELIPTRNRLAKELEQHYAQKIIADKYCNLVAVTQMYEYFELERCDTLTGPYGAYNLFESELRANIIIMQLDKIQENQQKIYSVILEIGATLNAIEYELGAIHKDINSNGNRILSGIDELNNSLKSQLV